VERDPDHVFSSLAQKDRVRVRVRAGQFLLLPAALCLTTLSPAGISDPA
jgi:hypothetical protein